MAVRTRQDRWPELDKITDAVVLERELQRVRHEHSSVRLHVGIGYVTPEGEHHGRGGMIRKKRAEGMRAARAACLAYWREHRTEPEPSDRGGGEFAPPIGQQTQKHLNRGGLTGG